MSYFCCQAYFGGFNPPFSCLFRRSARDGKGYAFLASGQLHYGKKDIARFEWKKRSDQLLVERNQTDEYESKNGCYSFQIDFYKAAIPCEIKLAT